MRQTLLLFTTLAIFFVLATATSQLEPANEEYECTVLHQGNDIIIISESNQNIASASLAIVQDSLPGVAYFVNAYSLAAQATDTIPFEDFKSNANQTFPAGEKPTSFLMEFISGDTIFSKQQIF